MIAQTPPLRFFFSLTAAVLFLAENPASAQLVTNAYDNAGNYSNSSDWTNGANGGFGFGAWNLYSSGGTGGFGGNFIKNPTNADIIGMATNSFGLFANPTNSGAYANAERSISVPLAVGQSLRFQWSINWDSGAAGNKGFDLSAGTNKIMNVQNGDTEAILLLNISTGLTYTLGFGYGTNAMTWTFTRSAPNTITVEANDRDGTGTFSYDFGVVDGAMSKINFYAYQMQAGEKAQPYFNNLEVFGPSATNPYSTWAASYGLDPQVTTGPTAGAPSADPENDGFINNVEFAFDGNPTNGTPALITTTATSTDATFRYIERNSGVAYAVQKNSTLTNAWSNAVGLVISNSADPNGVLLPSDYTRKEFIVPASGKDFYRVIATVPAQ